VLAKDLNKLPKWVGVVLTSRPEAHIKDALEMHDPMVVKCSTETNLKDLRLYIRTQLKERKLMKEAKDVEAAVEELANKANGLFLYAGRALERMDKGSLTVEYIAKMPAGMNGWFLDTFKRLRKGDKDEWDAITMPLLQLVMAAASPLTVYGIIRCLSLTCPSEDPKELKKLEARVRDQLESLASFFPLRGDGDMERVQVQSAYALFACIALSFLASIFTQCFRAVRVGVSQIGQRLASRRGTRQGQGPAPFLRRSY
jgi:hypothetical protein